MIAVIVILMVLAPLVQAARDRLAKRFDHR